MGERVGGKRQILNLNRFLLELAIIRKMDID